MHTITVARVASVIVALEGLALLVLAGSQVAAIAAGDTASLTSAIALVVLVALGAIAVLAFAVAIWRGISWGRSGAIVTQILILAVAFGAVTGVYANLWTGLALAVPAVVALVLLVLSVRGAGRPGGLGDEPR